MSEISQVSRSPLREAEMDRAFESAQQLVDWKAVDVAYPRGSNAIFTSSVVLLTAAPELFFAKPNPASRAESANCSKPPET